MFVCQNPDCGKESCRLCHEISHIPKKCDEVEKNAEVRKRTFIENKMAEAMMRECYSCKKKFVKVLKKQTALKIFDVSGFILYSHELE